MANARAAYERFQRIFAGPRWERLAAAGAHVQRPLWCLDGDEEPPPTQTSSTSKS